MTSRQLRLTRAIVISAVATLIAAVSHTIGGGAAPHPLLIAAVSVLITPLTALLVGVRASRARTAATVVLTQAAFHLVFQMLGAPTVGSAVGVPGHVHAVDLTAFASLSAVPAPTLEMTGAHLLAAILTTALLWHGESLMATVAGWVHALLHSTPEIAPATHRRPAPPVSAGLPFLVITLAATLTRRGPPSLLRG